MVSASAAAIFKRRHRVAAAIFGQKVGLAMLVCVRVSSCFLHRRIFFSLTAAPSAPAAQSGTVPSGDRGGCICKLCIGGSSQLDHVFAIFGRALSVKDKDFFVISLLFVVLHVNMYPQPD
jgi:hypothetical protein